MFKHPPSRDRERAMKQASETSTAEEWLSIFIEKSGVNNAEQWNAGMAKIEVGLRKICTGNKINQDSKVKLIEFQDKLRSFMEFPTQTKDQEEKLKEQSESKREEDKKLNLDEFFQAFMDSSFCESNFICPLSQYPMLDPVIASDGNSYDKSWLEGLFNSSNTPTSPVTREKLDKKVKIPNNNLSRLIRTAIENFKNSGNNPYKDFDYEKKGDPEQCSDMLSENILLEPDDAQRAGIAVPSQFPIVPRNNRAVGNNDACSQLCTLLCAVYSEDQGLCLSCLNVSAPFLGCALGAACLDHFLPNSFNSHLLAASTMVGGSITATASAVLCTVGMFAVRKGYDACYREIPIEDQGQELLQQQNDLDGNSPRPRRMELN